MLQLHRSYEWRKHGSLTAEATVNSMATVRRHEVAAVGNGQGLNKPRSVVLFHFK